MGLLFCFCLSHKTFQILCRVIMVFSCLFFLNSCFRLFSLFSHPDFSLSHAPCLTAFFSLARPFPTLALQNLPSIPRAQRPPCARSTLGTLWSWTARCQRQLPSCGPKTARRLFQTTVRSLSASSCTSAMLHRPTRACTHARPLALRPLMRFASLLMSQVRGHDRNRPPMSLFPGILFNKWWHDFRASVCILSLGRSKPPFSVIVVFRFCPQNLQTYIKHALFERLALVTFLFPEFDAVVLDVDVCECCRTKRVECFVLNWGNASLTVCCL